MSEDSERVAHLLSKILEQISRPLATVPVSFALWDTEAIGVYLNRSINRVRSDIVSLPTFPKPIRLPVSGRSQALYKAREVIAWAESFQSTK